jgi:hypothetical protein
MIQSRQPAIYVPRRHGILHGPLTLILALWAIAFPGLLLLLASLGPIGALLGVGAAILLLVPWSLGLLVLFVLRRLS